MTTPSAGAQNRVRIIPTVVAQHAEDAIILHAARTRLAAGPHVMLAHLRRFDDRLLAHLDGLSVAGPHAWRFCEAALEVPTASSLFVPVVCAIEDGQAPRIETLFALAETSPDLTAGLISAFGWVSRDRLAGIGRDLLAAESPFRRRLGLAACRLHRVDAGPPLTAGLRDSDVAVRGEALRTAGELGRQDLLTTVTAAIEDDDPDCRFWAGRSAVLLGDRNRGVAVLAHAGLADGPHRARAFRLALQAMAVAKGHAVLQQLAADPKQLRWLIEGSSIVGDPTYVPWLIKQMADDKTARLAGEAFSLTTGTDLAWLDLERKPPENFESGPNDNPEDPNVEMDPDDGLPWPDAQRIDRWWDANAPRFQAGMRHFMGAPVTRAHCIEVLKNGYQRQRMLAARYLCLLNPGTPLFNTSAPAWRQQRLAAQME
jgi:uncharacterized protein (TIGR02270 family)